MLITRPVEIKLMIAAMATANTPLVKYIPGSTFSRYEAAPSESPYVVMWRDISDYYDSHDMSSLSNRAIKKLYVKALADSPKVRSNVDRWENFGWTEYEYKRAEKIKRVASVGRIGLVIGLAFLGVSLPTDA